jgi:hypothetical protein
MPRVRRDPALAWELQCVGVEGVKIMSKTTDDLKTEIKKTMSLLLTLRDEARVKIHLAGMDVKAAWKSIEPKIEEAEKIAEDASEATLKTITGTAKKLEKLVASL